MSLNKKLWLNIALVNLFIVALLGTLMRYKIGFEFPYFLQKHIQHAHSHFAFAGWISHVLIVLMTLFLARQKQHVIKLKKYNILILSNLICAYGVLVSFFIQGYAFFSITFSTLTVFISYVLTWFFIRDLRKHYKNHPSSPWFIAALVFNVISSFGTFALAYMMVTKYIPTDGYLASIYYYLHFQYNGWFFFACVGLLVGKLFEILPDFKLDRSIFWMFFLSCFPAYFLSTLWMKIPVWLYIIVIIAALVQVLAFIKLMINLKPYSSNFKKSMHSVGYFLMITVVISLSIKLMLQLGSTIPLLSKLAFGFRAIVIAYLHLALLAVISIFLLSYIYGFRMLRVSQFASFSVILFLIGVFLNEGILAIQGIASFKYILIPYANQMLFFAACVLALSAGMLFFSQLGKGLASEQ